MSTKFKHLKMVYEICMRPNVPLKNLFFSVILTFYSPIFGPEAYVIYGAIIENYTTEKIGYHDLTIYISTAS